MRRFLPLVLATTVAARANEPATAIIVVENCSSATVYGLQLSLPDENDWSDDLLMVDLDPSGALAPGASTELSLPAGPWDVRVLGDGGAERMVISPVIVEPGLVLYIRD